MFFVDKITNHVIGSTRKKIGGLSQNNIKIRAFLAETI